MILSISPTTRPDWMAKVEEYLGRPCNQDIFADCTNEVEDQLREQLAESVAAAKTGFADSVWDWPPSEGEEGSDDDLPAGWQPRVSAVAGLGGDGGGGRGLGCRGLANAIREENEGGEQLLEAEGVEEGPGEEYEVVEMEETVTA